MSGEGSREAGRGRCREKRRSAELRRRQGKGRRPWSRGEYNKGCKKKRFCNEKGKKLLRGAMGLENPNLKMYRVPDMWD